ncbi:Necrosis-inducing secreted protein 1 [Cladobotryum mycophilum]|uniref:Necrosis-inducing secreted protein 1 n=1 Tax=Cladobotryum mycophilum TaxID=491253 RepID=A0ABR0SB94_9HYPO
MKFTLAAFASLLAVAQGRIYGISVPETIRPGDTVDVTIIRQNYIQTVYDVAISIGWAPGDGYPQSLGRVADSFFLGPKESNKVDNLTKKITIPADAPKGDAIITASLMSLYGAVYGPTLSNYNVTVTFGDATSTVFKSSNQ